MKALKQSKFWLASIVVMGLTACGSSPEKEEDCPWPDNGKGTAPGWVCTSEYKDYKITAVGSYENTPAGYDFQRKQAAASARDDMAQEFETFVRSKINAWTQTTGAGDAATVDRLNKAMTDQLAKVKLRGSKIVTMRKNPKTGVLYVLVGVDNSLADEYTENALKTSMNNQKALWQKMQGEKDLKDMVKEIMETE